MPTYIALLRGINVSGQKKIKMADLKSHLEEIGFENVQTYIQSGNVLFESDESSIDKLENRIIDKIKEKYGWDVPTLVKTATDFQRALDNNPYVNDKEDQKVYFVFLKEEPAPEHVDKLAQTDYSPELYTIDGKNIYLYPANGFGKAKLNNNLFEAKLKVQATTRNLKTVRTLLEMAGN